MGITPQNFVNHELIGLRVTLVKSTNKDAVGLSGRIIDESRNIFKLECCGQEKTAAKHRNTFEFTLPEGDKVRVAGDLVLGRPEDRAAKSIRKWHNR
ncbi:MAG TPA: ribonuclease P protein component 1 [Candidatus Bathyarchaeia archaeon]|nr:ribonuclease P protein component 1 [Candidatus Bathyarchaeia archaeon]